MKEMWSWDLLCEIQLRPCRDALGVDRHRFAPCRNFAAFSPVAAAICPACSDNVPALRELSPHRRQPYHARRAAVTRCLDIFRTPPVDKREQKKNIYILGNNWFNYTKKICSRLYYCFDYCPPRQSSDHNELREREREKKAHVCVFS